MQPRRLSLIFGIGLSIMLLSAPGLARDWQVQQEKSSNVELIRQYKELLEKDPSDRDMLRRLLQLTGRGEGLGRLIEEYRTRVQKNPSRVNFCLILGHLFMAQNQFQQALAQYEAATQISPGMAHAWEYLADVHSVLEEYFEAIHAYDAALSQATSRAQRARLLEALVEYTLFQRRDIGRARGYASELLTIQPGNDLLRQEYARALSEMEDYSEAIIQLERLLRNVGRDSYRRLELLRELGEVYESMRNYDQALRAYERALSAGRQESFVYGEVLNKILDLYRRQGALAKAAETFETRWSRPSYYQCLFMAQLYEELGREDAALNVLDRAIGLRADVEPYVRKIRIFERQGRDDDVVATYESLISSRLASFALYFEFIQYHLKLGNRTEALALMKRLESQPKRQPSDLMQLVELYNQLGMNAQARALLERLIEMEPSNSEFRFTSGEFYLEQGERELAEHAFEKYLSLEKSTASASIKVAEFLMERGHQDWSLAYFEHTLQQFTGDMEVLTAAARAYERTRRWQRALELWHETVRHSAATVSERMTARMRIIEIHVAQNQLPVARRQWAAQFAEETPQLEAGYLLAWSYMHTMSLDKAEEIFLKLRAIKHLRGDDITDVLVVLKDIYTRTNRVGLALQISEDLVQFTKTPTLELLEEMMAQAIELRDETRLENYAELVLEHHQSAHAHRIVAETYTRRQHFEAALEHYSRAFELDSSQWNCRLAMADIHKRLRDYEAALRGYNDVVQGNSQDALVLRAARSAIDLVHMNSGDVDWLEEQWQPLHQRGMHSDLWLKVMIELYSRIAHPLVMDYHYGMFSEREERRAIEVQLRELQKRTGQIVLSALESRDQALRASAISLAGDLMHEHAAVGLAQVAVSDDSRLRAMAALAFARAPSARAENILVAALNDLSTSTRELATWCLAFVPTDSAMKHLQRLLFEGQTHSQRVIAALGIGHHIQRNGGSRGVFKELTHAIQKLADDYGQNRHILWGVLWSVGTANSPMMIPAFSAHLNSDFQPVKEMSKWAVSRMNAEDVLDYVVAKTTGSQILSASAVSQILDIIAHSKPDKVTDTLDDWLAISRRYFNLIDGSFDLDGVMVYLKNHVQGSIYAPGEALDGELVFDIIGRMVFVGDEDIRRHVLMLLNNWMAQDSERLHECIVQQRSDSACVPDGYHALLREGVRSENLRWRLVAVELLGVMQREQDFEVLLEAMRSKHWAVRRSAVRAWRGYLSGHLPARSRMLVFTLLRDSHPMVRAEVVALARFLPCLNFHDDETVISNYDILMPDRIKDVVAKMAGDDPSNVVQLAAMETLEKLEEHSRTGCLHDTL